MRRHWLCTILCILLAAGLAACQRERWETGENVRARDVDVAAALGDTSGADNESLAAADVRRCVHAVPSAWT
jgi:hypothetical protein